MIVIHAYNDLLLGLNCIGPLLCSDIAPYLCPRWLWRLVTVTSRSFLQWHEILLPSCAHSCSRSFQIIGAACFHLSRLSHAWHLPHMCISGLCVLFTPTPPLSVPLCLGSEAVGSFLFKKKYTTRNPAQMCLLVLRKCFPAALISQRS